MKNMLRRIAFGVSGVVIVALILVLAAPKAVHAIVSTLVTIANTASNPVPVQEVKHSTANYVTLEYDINNLVYDQLLSDGTTTPFTIPVGEKLVITDVNWVIACGAFKNTVCQNHVGDGVGVALGGSFNSPYGFYAAQTTFVFDGGNLIATGNDSFKSGVIVTEVPAPSFLAGQWAGQAIVTFTLRGYLVP
jgi:hypothetical protein